MTTLSSTDRAGVTSTAAPGHDAGVLGGLSHLRLRSVLLLAPIIFVAHFLEEGTGFVAWFNRHVADGITADLFWSVNLTALGITVLVVVLEYSLESPISAGIIVAWLGFLMVANALFHIVGALVDRAYMPGLITAVLLYLPFASWVLARVWRTRRLPRSAVILLTLGGALPMLTHGYLIIFRGSRLF